MFTVKQTFKSFESGSGGIVTNTIGTGFSLTLFLRIHTNFVPHS